MGKKNRIKKRELREAGLRVAAIAPDMARGGWNALGRDAAACAAVVILALIVFAQVYDQTYVNYDDGIYITDNREVQAGLTAENIVWAFAESHIGHYHPLTWISYMIDVSLFGVNAGPMKLVNLAFHIANSLLLFWLLRRLTGTFWRAFFVAVVFAVHPLHVEPVAWVASRKDMLSGLFFMLTLLAYTRYAQRKSWAGYGLAWFFCLLGLLSKPMLITLPCVLLLLDWWPLRRFSREEAPWVDFGALRRVAIEKIPFFALSGMSAVFTYLAGKKQDVLGTPDAYPMTMRAENALLSYGKYFRQVFWPSDLAPYYPHPGENIDLFYVALATVAVVAITVCAVYFWRRRPFAAMGWFWYLGMLVPVIGVIQISDHGSADRYMYLPLIGVLILTAWTAEALTADKPWRTRLWGVAAPLAVLALSASAYVQTGYWHDDEALYRYALSVEPNAPKMQTNLGITLRRQGKLDEAYKECLAAVKGNPNYADARMNMANVLYDMGQKKFESGDTAGAKGIFEEAEKEYREAIRMNPGNDNAYSNLGNVLVKLDRRDEGIALYQKALGMKEGNASAHNNLGGALFEMGRLDEAAAEFEKAIELDGKYLGAYTNFAMLRASQGRFAEAAKIQESAVRLKRGDPILLNMLGNFYFQAGLYGTSLEKYADVLEVNGGNVDALYSSGSACARMSDYEKALSWYDKALAINPEYGPAKADRETVRKLLEKQTATAQQQPPTPPTDGTPAQ